MASIIIFLHVHYIFIKTLKDVRIVVQIQISTLSVARAHYQFRSYYTVTIRVL